MKRNNAVLLFCAVLFVIFLYGVFRAMNTSEQYSNRGFGLGQLPEIIDNVGHRSRCGCGCGCGGRCKFKH